MRNPLFCVLLLLAAMAARGKEEAPRHTRQYGLTYLIRTLDYHPPDAWESPPEEANAIFANRRVAAAFVAGQTRHPDAEPLLRKLLDDPDMIVRRIAAQSLFGVGALRDEAARRYRYAEVLAAEEEARALADEIARHGLKKEDEGKVQTLDFNPDKETKARIDAEIRAINRRAYDATRELIALGRPAVWQLHRLTSHLDEEVALSAAYAFQEIDRRTENVAPLWAQEVERKLRKKVTVEFRNTPVEEALRRLSALCGVEIRWSADWMDYLGTEHGVTLAAKAMPAEYVLKWIISLADGDYTLTHGGVFIRLKMRITYDVGPFFVDVRDLEATGLQPDWMQRFNDEVLGERTWLGVPELATGLWNRGGILVIVVEEGPGRPEMMRPILAYLNRLREERGHPRGAE